MESLLSSCIKMVFYLCNSGDFDCTWEWADIYGNFLLLWVCSITTAASSMKKSIGFTCWPETITFRNTQHILSAFHAYWNGLISRS
jgi:hypothetical protein